MIARVAVAFLIRIHFNQGAALFTAPPVRTEMRCDALTLASEPRIPRNEPLHKAPTALPAVASASCDPTLETNLKLRALAQQCDNPKCNQLNRTALALEAYSLLRAMPNPDTVAYNTVLKALSCISPARLPPLLDDFVPLRSGSSHDAWHRSSSSFFNYSATSTTAAEQARLLLDEMVTMHHQQLEANQEWYQRLKSQSGPPLRTPDDAQGAAGGSASEFGGPPRIRVKPNVRSYSTVMDAFARHANPDAAAACADLLEQLQRRYEETGDGALEPNLVAYNTCLTAYARARMPRQCWDLFQTMPVDPDIISVNVVLHALARSGWDDAGERAQALLDGLDRDDDGIDNGGEGDAPSGAAGLGGRRNRLVGNARTYTTCMDAWARCGRPDKAHALLDDLLERYDASGGDVRYRPNCVTYSTVIHAYASSRDPRKASQAAEVFRGMCERGIRPNGAVLNALLNCFATARPRPDAMELVESLYRRILDRHSCCADQYTFGIALKAASRDPSLYGRDPDFAASVFRECRRRGFVSSGVLWQLRQAVPSATYRELVGCDGGAESGDGSELVEASQLPMEWRRNVDERKSSPSSRRAQPEKGWRRFSRFRT